ncbi:MAG: hypothetical protein ACRDP6_49300 [Actinoallomurus sp.]
MRPAAITASPRYRVIRAFAAASPGLLAAAVIFMLVEALLPNLVLIAMGRTVGDVPAAVVSGLGSPAGDRMLVQLIVAGVLYAISLLRGPVEDVLSTMAQERMSVVSQRRLIAAVSAPAGIAHLEDPAVLDRISGILACAVLATFHWWLGLGVLAMWLVLRRPLRTLVRSRAGTFRQATETLRRSWYFAGISWRRTR